MTLPSSGTLQASDINVELGRAWNHFFDMNGAAERNLAGKPSGAISFWDFYGKSNLIREPATGEHYSRDYTSWEDEQNSGAVRIKWFGAQQYWYPTGLIAITVGNWTYYRGSYRENTRPGGQDIRWHGIYRVGKY